MSVEDRIPSGDATSASDREQPTAGASLATEVPHVAAISQHVQQLRAVNNNNTPMPARGRERQRVNSNAGPSTQRVVGKVYSSTAEAIANFRPTSRQVISGIAPHVFDERKRRRSNSLGHRRSRSPKPYWHPRDTEKRSSPLRVTTSGVISWEDCSIYLEQSDTKRNDSTDKLSLHSVTVSETASIHVVEAVENIASSLSPSTKPRGAKSGWRLFVDIRSLKTVVDKLKLPTSHHASPKVKS